MTKSNGGGWMALAVLLIAASAAGCGGGDGDSGGGSASGSESAAGTPAIEDVRACLEEGGLDLSGETNLTPELQEVLGIEDKLMLAGDGDLVGLGAVTWYVDEDAAEEAYEAGGAVRTDDVARGVRGRLDYHYAGSDQAIELLEGCL